MAASLHGKAKSIKVVELPDRDGHQVKDVSDWLAAGGTLSELEQLVSKAPEWTPKEIVTAKKAKDTEGEEIRESSFLTLDHSLYEQIILDSQTAFIEYDTTSGEVQNSHPCNAG